MLRLQSDCIDHFQPLRCMFHFRAQLFERPLSGAPVEQCKHSDQCIFRAEALCNAPAVKFRKSTVKVNLKEGAVRDCFLPCLLPVFHSVLRVIRSLIIVFPVRIHPVKEIAFENLGAVEPDSDPALVFVVHIVVIGDEIGKPPAERFCQIFRFQFFAHITEPVHYACSSLILSRRYAACSNSSRRAASFICAVSSLISASRS